jgi:hypothetical protein
MNYKDDATRVFIIGCGSGFGQELLNYCQLSYQAQGVTRTHFNLLERDSVERLGHNVLETGSNIVVLNAYARTVDKEHFAYAQFNALKILWPMFRPHKLSFVVISSAITWNPPAKDPATRLYQLSKQAVADYCVKEGWLNTDNQQHKAQMVLFEPATMSNRAHLAKERKTPVLQTQASWNLIQAAIASELPFVRLGAQGGTHVS